MAKLSRYCKAYPLDKFLEFPDWPADQKLTAQELNGAPILYLHDDLSVTDGVFVDEHLVYNTVSPQWERFCADQLGFEVPEYLKG